MTSIPLEDGYRVSKEEYRGLDLSNPGEYKSIFAIFFRALKDIQT